jgi:hypothetical protein
LGFGANKYGQLGFLLHSQNQDSDYWDRLSNPVYAPKIIESITDATRGVDEKVRLLKINLAFFGHSVETNIIN